MNEDDSRALVVFDFGKTNAKMFVFAPDLSMLGQERCAPAWREHRIGSAPCRVLDSEHLWRWMNEALARAQQRWPVGGVMISTHGCTAALVGNGELQFPIVDYESEPPAAVNTAYADVAPGFDETLSPNLPGGLNLARQIFWIESAHPEVLARTQAILSLPQYWSWKLGGRAVSEVSSLGCHSQLWSPRANDFSALADKRGWRALFPPFERAGAVLGHTPRGLRVHNGVHDSNASLYLYRSLGHADCTVVSTGTWVIVFNTGCPLDALDRERDMLANVTVDGEPVATARFMGGREFDLITRGARCEVNAAHIEAAIRRGQCALPSFAPGGPYPARAGSFVGPPAETDAERAAIGTLYLAFMTDSVLNAIHSNNPVIVDGGLAHNHAYLGLLAALRQPQPVLCNRMAEGSAAGAAVLACEAFGRRPQLEVCEPVDAWPVNGLAQHLAFWRHQLNRNTLAS